MTNFVNLYDTLLKHDFDYNFLVGGRSNGKTTAIQKYVIDNYINDKKEFVKFVRYPEDSYNINQTNWWSENSEEYLKEHNLSIRYIEQKYYIGKSDKEDLTDKQFKKDGTIIGRVIPLSQEERKRSTNLENVTTIIFEEFASKNEYVYIPHEIEYFKSAISTIVRSRKDKIKCFLIGNALNIYNPYFEYFGIDAMKLKAGNTYHINSIYEEFARIGIYFAPPVHDNIEDTPRILRIPDNTQALNMVEYELPNILINDNDWLVLALKNNRFTEYYNIKYILHYCNEEDTTFKKNLSILHYVIIEDKKNKNNIYIINTDKYNKEYGLQIKLNDVNKKIYKLDNDIRLKLRQLPKDYFIDKNLKLGDIEICNILKANNYIS